MKDYKKYTLGREALFYIKKRLSAGKTIGQLLLNKIDFSLGTIHTMLPHNIDVNSLIRFEEGGKIEVSENEFIYTEGLRIRPVYNTDGWLESKILNFLERENGICVFENSLAQLEDPWLASRKSRIFLYGNEVYHFVDVSAEPNEIHEALREAKSAFPLFIGIMSFSHIVLNDNEKVDKKKLEKIVKGTSKLIIGAYDGESYLIWQKSD